MRTELAVLDMAGTTVRDDGLVIRAFDEAATAVGVPEDGAERDRARRYVVDTMGQSKIEVFRALFGSDDRAQAANTAFEKAYDHYIDGGVQPVPGAAEAISQLRASGVQVALTTGFSPATQQRILDTLGWDGLADLVLAPGPGVRGRPHPDLVLTALMRAGVDDVRSVAVVGDTASDVTCGLRAGAVTVAGVLTGAHDERALRAAGATHVLDSVARLPELLLSA
ncbi:phosphonatase-like hydrolase [Mycolicibacterium monacense]|uniref:Haloacid dehalogenase-like hydrolase n=2 Tax=Mycobacteriaceae TaxID=1762 RepID=A0AAD1IW68_MYCMB|nr:phosphonatase-like hydrolase [Mycolicibacterium monacense]OBB73272.1 haloacid dehalogenase [Mycolicibacterium monacense]ORB23395.1 haloacid dehalogenase [Mycolicibacterium monacense DSM 44395]QHP85114.1 phosphonatase-like hydrolase [Mycolicibacterium monacense DSM 44395]BBZ62051.1 putative haloacid dehalogenase-like hydrolase [Mycolicibacterium monacense]